MPRLREEKIQFDTCDAGLHSFDECNRTATVKLYEVEEHKIYDSSMLLGIFCGIHARSLRSRYKRGSVY